MIIDLTELLNLERQEIIIEENISFPESYLNDSEIKDIGPVTVKGNIHLEQELVILNGIVSGEMQIVDAISLENISYPFSFEIDEDLTETLENNEKSLDIMDILWQNIVLEVPLRHTEVTDFSKYQGDGWKLVKEEDMLATNNPFSELVNMMGEE